MAHKSLGVSEFMEKLHGCEHRQIVDLAFKRIR